LELSEPACGIFGASGLQLNSPDWFVVAPLVGDC